MESAGQTGRELKYFYQLSHRLEACYEVAPFSACFSQFHFESSRNLRHHCCFCGKGFKAKAPASKIVSVNVPQRLRRLLLLGVALPLYWLPAALVVLWAAPVVLESEERSDKNRGLPAQRSHRYRRANCYTSIY